MDAQPYMPPNFSHPRRQIVLMLILLALVGVGTVIALPEVWPVFSANKRLNGFILGVFVIGVLSCFWQIWQLIRSVRWIELFTGMRPQETPEAPQLLAPLATLMRGGGANMQLSATSSRSILDSVATRIEEDREISRYIVNTLIYLGLLGTFYGLATTVPALVDTIRSLSPKEGEEGLAIFNRLIAGLEQQLGGMGVAFASSLLGLAGSLVLGLLELFAGHGQNRFYRELEEWLSTITRLSLASGDDANDREVMEAVLGQMNDQVEALHGFMQSASTARAHADAQMEDLGSALRQAAHALDTSDMVEVLRQVAHTQTMMADKLSEGGMEIGLDAESRMRLRSIDVQLLRLTEDQATARAENMADLRAEFSRLAATLMDERGQ